ncbi:MAG TPA: DUF3352 domain-containing protein [Nocardioidaceae bacterium]|nr:DUF3352 domain-containing protein [Nocardioidaceae bacterium]
MKTFITIGLSAGAVGAMVAGGLAVSSFLSGGGTQPEDVLPSTAIGFAKLDLNPPAGQKLNALRLMRKFPDIKDEGDDLKATIVESLLDDADLDLKYEADIEPWLGDRAGIAVVPSDSYDEGVATLIALEFTDEAAMVAALEKAEKQIRSEREELYEQLYGSRRAEDGDAETERLAQPSHDPTDPADSFTAVEPSAAPEEFTVPEPGTTPGDSTTVEPIPVPEPGTTPGDSTTVEPIPVPELTVEEHAENEPLPSPEPDLQHLPGTAPEEHDPFYYAIRENYVILSEHQSDVDAAAGAAQVLSSHRSFTADKAAIDGDDQIVLGWLNVGAVYDVIPQDEKADFAEMLGSARPAGRVVVGVHAEPDAVEAVGRTIDLEAAGAEAIATGDAGTGLVKDLPANTSVAFSATGLGDLAVDLWDRYGSEPFLDATDEAEALGLNLPDDLVALLGQEAAAGLVIDDQAGLDFSATARVRTEAADRALEVIELFEEETAEEFHAEPAADGYVVGWDPDDMIDAANGDMTLGDNPVFANAVPDADDASVLLFVDIPDLVTGLDAAFGGSDPDGSEGSEGSESLPLQAFGATAAGEAGNGEFKLRLTFR